MDGDIAPLKDLVALSEKFNSLLMIDDAHAMGVVGKTGRGGLEHFGIKSRDIIQMGTLSKAAGCFGGFVAGNRELIDLLVNRARSFIYSTSLPPAVAAASIRAIKILDSGSDYRRKKLWKNRERMYQGLKNIGFDTIDSETPIIPVMVGETKEALRIGSHLYSNKIFTPAIRPPTVSEGKCRIRFTVTAGHTYKDIDMALEAMKKIK
jgi:7-keto-8-aminopelargonate synthetase-like enzyme